MGFGAANRWAVRTSGDPSALSASVRAAVASVNPRVGVIDVQPMLAFVGARAGADEICAGADWHLRRHRAVLAAVGLYSVLSTTVRQRRAEIGVRMAFGAEHGRIFRMMVVQGLKLSAAGLVVRRRRGARS